jgi:hypothetical protein
MHVLRQLRIGDFLGDMNPQAVLTIRTSSAIANTDVKLLRIDIGDWIKVHQIAAAKELSDKVDLIRNWSIFAGLDDEAHLHRMAEHCTLMEYPTGACIIREGEHSDDVYLIRKVHWVIFAN